LEVENFPYPSAYKEIWIDIGFTGTLTNASASGTGGVLSYTTIDLDPGGPSDVAEWGWRIYPNPWKEDIFFSIVPTLDQLGQVLVPATLDWIHVDTICIPAPGDLILVALV